MGRPGDGGPCTQFSSACVSLAMTTTCQESLRIGSSPHAPEVSRYILAVGSRLCSVIPGKSGAVETIGPPWQYRPDVSMFPTLPAVLSTWNQLAAKLSAARALTGHPYEANHMSSAHPVRLSCFVLCILRPCLGLVRIRGRSVAQLLGTLGSASCATCTLCAAHVLVRPA